MMLGYAEFKSHVTRRDEKGMFGVPFKRLLGCGLGTGALFTVLRMAIPDVAIPLGVLSFVVLLVMTTPGGGIPRWKHLLYGLRWWLLTAVSLTPASFAGQVGRALGLPAGAVDLDASELFRLDDEDAPRTALSDWVSFTQPFEQMEHGVLALQRTPELSAERAA